VDFGEALKRRDFTDRLTEPRNPDCTPIYEHECEETHANAFPDAHVSR
jgi:hypothetical protein